MLTKSILTATLTATAIALVAGLGSASAADEFTTLDGVAADVMSATELSATVGAGIVIVVDLDGEVSGLGTNDIIGANVLRGVPPAQVGDQIAILLDISDPFVFVAPVIIVGVP